MFADRFEFLGWWPIFHEWLKNTYAIPTWQAGLGLT
jgi:hypothetical protein